MGLIFFSIIFLIDDFPVKYLSLINTLSLKNVKLEQLRYPIGKFNKPSIITSQHLETWIKAIATFPVRLKKLVEDLEPAQYQWQYRPHGWTIAQVIHHCADSHMNSFIRFKLALTEPNPTIKPYLEAVWAELPDVSESEALNSIKILEGVHARWTILLQSLQSSDWKKSFIHPEHNKHFFLDENAGIYAWHSNHHLAHIRQAIATKGQP